MTLLQIIALNKSYKKKKVIRDLSLDLHSGEIMGLIGANGSGKTTIFKSVLGLVKIDSGKIVVKGQTVDEKSRDFLNAIGTIIEYPTFYESLTASQNLQLISSLYNSPNLSQKAILEQLKWVGLEDEADSQVSSFSLGMKQRLGLDQALLHQPSILLLDEPFNGLDPKGIKDLRELLTQLSNQGVGIIVSSHSLEELNKLVDTVTIIDKGKLIFQGKKSDYLSLGARRNSWLLETDDKQATEAILKELKISYKITGEGFDLSISAEIVEDTKGELLADLLQKNVSIRNFSEQKDNFEDIFLNIQTTGEVDHD